MVPIYAMKIFHYLHFSSYTTTYNSHFIGYEYTLYFELLIFILNRINISSEINFVTHKILSRSTY